MQRRTSIGGWRSALALVVLVAGAAIAIGSPEGDPPGFPGRAKNIVFFLGDGMGLTTVTAARIRAGQLLGESGEDHRLSFERFPQTAFSATFSADFQTTDSAAGMTAPMCGVKSRNGVLGFDETVARGDAAAAAKGARETILEIAEEMGKSTGVVSTTRVTHATPAACYAHSADRDWEDDSKLPEPARGIAKDIARQALEFPRGDGLEVLMGGGRANFLPKGKVDGEGAAGLRGDGRDLTAEWAARGRDWTYVWNREGFDAVDPAKTKHLLGLFDASHLAYEADRAGDEGGEPSLSEMTAKAIDILSRNRKGFFLMVEGGRIDHAHHATNAFRALDETIEFARAVAVAVGKVDLEETLVLVTADHSHSFCLTGYARRGNPILGVVEKPGGSPAAGADGLPYPVLAYGVGGKVQAEGKREKLTREIAEGRDFRQAAAYPGPSWSGPGNGQDTHAGEDVPVYATGAGSGRVHGVLDNTDLFGVMRAALRGE